MVLRKNINQLTRMKTRFFTERLIISTNRFDPIFLTGIMIDLMYNIDQFSKSEQVLI